MNQRVAAVRPQYGVVLAGGASRRMGGDKAELDYAGVPALERAVAVTSGVVGEVYVSVGAGQADDALRARYRCLHDPWPGEGPMAGVLAALAHAPGAAWLVVAVDLPLLDRATLDALVAARDPNRDAVVYVSPADKCLEPLCALYEASARAPLAAAFEHGERSLSRALERLEVVRLQPVNPRALFNANTPEEAAEARTALSSETGHDGGGGAVRTRRRR